MRFGALGDIHGNFEAVERIMRRHADIPFWICVGDVADADGRYAPFAAPLHWIKGNNENFDAIDSRALPANLHFMPNAHVTEAGGLRIAGLGGTFAPSWYETPARDLPHPGKSTAKATELADKRRHFVREEVDACKRLQSIDVFMTHEAPRPFRIGSLDAGKTPVNEILSAMKPRLHLFGHHHRFSESERGGVPSVGLDLVGRSYLILDGVSLKYDVMIIDA